MPNHSELRKDLVCARDIIKEHGWIQRRLGSRNVGYCLVGALVKAVGTEKLATRLGGALDHLGRFTDGDTVPNWNDTEGRTREEVLELLETAIECTK